ncbi:MAG TPA: ABC transporter permease subunit [Steroidobacteraceae bacterium]|nr:ABC transporter permease subunit [Steroidobacteraceae bacterium]
MPTGSASVEPTFGRIVLWWKIFSNTPVIQGIKRRIAGRPLVIAFPYLWLLLFFVIPFVIVLKISFAESRIAMPPYSPFWEWTSSTVVQIKLTLSNYAFLFQDALYGNAYLSSLRIAGISTIFCLLLGYPMAYGMARSKPSTRNILLLLVVLPFWTSFLLRVYAWIGLLKNNGVINNILISLGIIDEPIVMMQTDFAVYLGIVYSYLPFMILPLYSTLEKMDLTLLEAAADLGCRPMKAFLKITLPLSLPGIVAGCMLVFIPAVGEYVIPALLGGPDTLMIGRVLWDEFFANRDWPVASAVAIAMLLLLVVPIMIFQYSQGRELRGHK